MMLELAAIETPITDPVVVFLLAMVIFLTAPLVLQRYRLPGIVGIMLVGAAIGPNAAGLLERGETIVSLGEVGVIYLMFIAGLEINYTQFIETRTRSATFGLLSFLIPQAAGTVAGVAVLDMSWPAALLFASIFASHTLLAYPVVTRLGIANRESVTATVGGTIVTDTIALLVLAVVVAAELGSLDAAFWIQLVLGLVAFFVGVWVIVPRLSRWFFRTLNQESYFEYLFVMAIVFGAAFLAELAGVEAIIGAFLAGLALNRHIPARGPLMNRIEFVGNALFIPFFLLSVGMLIDVRVILAGGDTLLVSVILVGLVFATKWLAAWVTGSVFGYTTAEQMTMFGLSVGQAAAALAIVLIGFDIGLFEESVLNGTIVMILVVSVLSPAIVDRYGRDLVQATPYDPDAVPQRILVPFARGSDQGEQLLDLALAVRDPEHGSLYALTVVNPGYHVSADIAAAEDELDAVTAYASGADVPVITQTRVDHNPASGIVRATVENRITTLVIGWDGAASRRQRVFGETIDQILTRSRQLVLVSRLHEPINTTSELLVVLPPGIERNDGILEALFTITQVAAHAGAPIRALVVDGEPATFDRLFGETNPAVQTTVNSVDGWRDLFDRLEADANRGRLIVAVSARREAPGWQPQLQTLPKSIASLTPGNFVIVYPASGEQRDDRQFLQFQ